jgi:hypothetical protein
VAGNSSDDARRSEEGKFHWRSGLVSYTVAFTPVINGELKQVTTMRWRCLDTRHKARRRRSPVSSSDSTVVCVVQWPE